MTAELEEVVVATDLLDLQQLLPDLRQGALDLTLGRLVRPRTACISVRQRQPRAIKLARLGVLATQELDVALCPESAEIPRPI